MREKYRILIEKARNEEDIDRCEALQVLFEHAQETYALVRDFMKVVQKLRHKLAVFRGKAPSNEIKQARELSEELTKLIDALIGPYGYHTQQTGLLDQYQEEIDRLKRGLE